MKEEWIKWARKLQSIAQNGLTFAENEFDVQRYNSINKIAAEIFSGYLGNEFQKIYDMFKYQSGYATPKVDVRGSCF